MQRALIETMLELILHLTHITTCLETEKVWILQMPERPGFDRFLLRLGKWGLRCTCNDVCTDAYQLATNYMGKVAGQPEDFKLFVITQSEKVPLRI